MSVLSSQTIRRLSKEHPPLIAPFHKRTRHESGLTYGLSGAGYDIRIREEVELWPGDFVLASSIEHFHVPNNVRCTVHDKSTLARLGLAVQNTIFEPGWKGYPTLEISDNRPSPSLWQWILHFLMIREIRPNYLRAGQPVAQVSFELLDEATDQPYVGRYQDQGPLPVPARFAEEACKEI